jgi:tetratricopeptide (TPR) repeat protein
MMWCVPSWVHAVILVAAASTPVAGQDGPRGAAVHEAAQLLAQDDHDGAIALLRPRVASDPDDAAAAHYLGRAYLEADELDEAEAWLKRAVELEASSAHFQWLGRVYGLKAQRASVIRRVGLAGKMKDSSLRAVELDPDNVDARQDLMESYLQAPGIAGGDTRKAREQADEILKRDSYMGHLAWGRVHEDAGNDSAFIEWYQAAIRLRPAERAPYYPLAYAQQRLGDFDGARQTLMAVLERWPDDPGARYQLGRNAAMSGEWLDEGEGHLRAYIELADRGQGNPSEAAARWRLALVLEHQGRSEEALREIEASRRLDPDFEQSKDDLERLRKANR